MREASTLNVRKSYIFATTQHKCLFVEVCFQYTRARTKFKIRAVVVLSVASPSGIIIILCVCVCARVFGGKSNALSDETHDDNIYIQHFAVVRVRAANYLQKTTTTASLLLLKKLL